MKVMEVTKVRRYKVGYEVRTEIIDGSEYSCEDVEMRSAYTTDGHYIGDPKIAHRLIVRMGIAPELSTKTNKVCSIGYCKKNRKWYGWSHRAIFGFGIGSTVKEGDCAAASLPVGFKAHNLDNCRQMAVAFAESVS